MRMAFIAFAAHASTDNVLIATTACVFFTFATALFVRPDTPVAAFTAASLGSRRAHRCLMDSRHVA
jgi:hypothetical protein